MWLAAAAAAVVVLAPLAGCGDAPADAGAPPPTGASTSVTFPPPVVTATPGGGLSLDPGYQHVATVRRQPDGSYRRFCAPPSDAARRALERAHRAMQDGANGSKPGHTNGGAP